jgi:heterodisulfide reductase subunit A
MEDIRIGVYVCWCGSNIAKMVDVVKVAKDVAKLPNVVVAREYKYMCSDPGQDLIIRDIKEYNLNRIVVASCSPRMHEPTFRKVVEKAGLNEYLLEMANIREHDSWVHDDRKEATEKAFDLIAGAVYRVFYHEPLEKRYVDINPAVLIIGGGITGMVSALIVAKAGYEVYLVEKTNQLGGLVNKIDLTFPYFYSAQQMLNSIIMLVKKNPNIKVFLNANIEDISGYVGNFKGIISNNGKKTELDFGNIIVATGLKPFDPSSIQNYGYKSLPNVITSIEFEEMLLNGIIKTKNNKIPENIAIIHCVGSRNKDYHEYCSRTCCSVALKFINQIQACLPKSNIYDIYADMRTFDKGCEELYTETSKKNVIFLQFDQQNGLPLIRKASKNEECEMIIELKELSVNEYIEVPADLVILMVGVEAHDDVTDVGHLIGCSVDNNKFFIERHPKLDPVGTTTDGVYIAGNCQSPKNIPDSISQAKAAAARALSTILRRSVRMESITASINEEICCGCQTCIQICPYRAIKYDTEKKVSVVNEVLCKGCGACVASCPTGALNGKHFTDKQIISQIEGILKGFTYKEA